jgi:signal transduction histidine kinase
MKLHIRPRSIAFRLIVAVLAVELLSAILVAVLSFGYERHIHFRAFDIMLHGHADSILGAVQDAEDPGDNVMLDQADLHLPPEDVYQVWDESGRVLGVSPHWQGSDAGRPTHPWGDFSQILIDGHHYRMLRTQGTRTVDPGDKGGGKLHTITIVYASPTRGLWHAVRGAVEFYAFGSLLLLVITGPLIAWLLHRALFPLRQLATLASQVSVDSWSFSPPLSARTTTELAPLTHALESVLARLERSFLQQRAFVSDAAHELKTAVAVVKSSLQLLNMKTRSPQAYQAGLERCLADSLRLESLVADMLTLARAESPIAGRQSPLPHTDPIACIHQAVTLLETIAALRHVQVRVSIDSPSQIEDIKSTGFSPSPGPPPEPGALAPLGTPHPIRVPLSTGDCTLLLSNLLLNALQHSPPQSIVELSLHADSIMTMTIQDHGDGIPADALPHVFDRFYRGDPSRTRNTGGTGLGLAIAQAIARRAGGSIAIASQPDPARPDQGTRVTVQLPLLPLA